MTALPLMFDPVVADDEAGLGCLVTPRGNLPLHAINVDARVTGLLHTTRVRQTFTNPHDEPLEATYIFPLPDRAAVTAFRMEVGDRVVEGVLKERAEARRAYDEAIESGRRAAIAEEERPNVFTVRVGNLLAGDRATVELTLIGPLALDSGEATWRFPLVVAPRYIPGTPLPGPPVGDGTTPDTDAVPDASRITPPVLLPGFPNPVRLAVRVELDAAGLPVSGIRSSLPADIDANVVTIRPGQRLDRDLVVRFAIGAGGIGESLVAHDGTFALTLVPPAQPTTGSAPRDVVFVLDRSGSMEGWKMIAARRAVARMIDTLGTADRFTLLAFDNTVEYPPALGTGLVSATDRQRFRAVEYLAGLPSRGGTEMLAPLQQAMSLLASDDRTRQRILVLATDGQVGNEDQILAAVAPMAAGVRIFTVGIDTAVNDAFLRRLAAIGGGSCEVVESEDRLDEVMDRIHRRISTPLLAGIAVTGAGLDIDPTSLAPMRLPALHEGVPLLVFGRYLGEATGAVRVTATDAAGKPWYTEIPVTATGNGALAPAWARARLRDLEDQYVIASGDAAIEREIVRTSLEGQVLSRFTAFVAVDVKVVVEGGTPRKVTQPVDVPYGWDMFDAPNVGGSVPMAVPLGHRVAAAPSSASGAAYLPAMAQPPMPAPMAAPMVASGGRFGRSASPPSGTGPMAKSRAVQRDRARNGEENELALDLAPYRQRAATLAEQVAGGDIDADRLRRELAELLDDLRSVGATDPGIDGLVALLATLDDGTWSGDLAALHAFATGAAGKHKPFWKR